MRLGLCEESSGMVGSIQNAHSQLGGVRRRSEHCADAGELAGTPIGGFDSRPGTLLHTGTKEAIRAHAHRVVWEADMDRFIFGADCSLRLTST